MFSRSCRSAFAAVQASLRHKTTAPTSHTSTSSAIPSLPPQPLTEAKYAASVVHGRSLRPPHYLPKSHRIPVATLHFRSYHPKLLDFFVHFATHAATALGIPISKPVHLPTQRTLWTVLRGPFVHKKSQENFERRTHKRVLKAWDANPEVVDMLVQYLEKHIAPGVGLRTTKWRRAPVGVGAKTLEAVIGHMRLDDHVMSDKLKALGDQIVKQELASAAGAAKQGALENASPAPSTNP